MTGTNLNVDDIMELLEFICSTTYYTFDGKIMQQKFGTAMGSPVSAVIANFYMEKLKHKALQTAPAEWRPNIWKRYVDDVLDVIKKDQVKNFTDHLNSIEDTNSIKFTYEEETNGIIPFLDLLINRQPDKTVKIQVYLHFQSHHQVWCCENFDGQERYVQKDGIKHRAVATGLLACILIVER